jgi:hypothetical protein
MTAEWCDCGRLNQDPCDVCRSLACEDAPKLAHEMAHANIGALLWTVRDIIDDLIKIRNREFGPLLDNEAEELIKIAGSLTWLLTDLQVAKANKNAQDITRRFQRSIERLIDGQA